MFLPERNPVTGETYTIISPATTPTKPVQNGFAKMNGTSTPVQNGTPSTPQVNGNSTPNGNAQTPDRSTSIHHEITYPPTFSVKLESEGIDHQVLGCKFFVGVRTQFSSLFPEKFHSYRFSLLTLYPVVFRTKSSNLLELKYIGYVLYIVR